MKIEEKIKEILWALREGQCIYQDGSCPCPPDLPDGSKDCALCAWNEIQKLFEEEKREILLQVHSQIKYYLENSPELESDLWNYLASLEGELTALKSRYLKGEK